MLSLSTLPGEQLHVLKGHMGVVRCLHLSEDRLVSGGDRKMVIVWSTKVRARMYVCMRMRFPENCVKSQV